MDLPCVTFDGVISANDSPISEIVHNIFIFICDLYLLSIPRPIEYEIFGEGSHILTNQKRENSAFSTLIG